MVSVVKKASLRLCASASLHLIMPPLLFLFGAAYAEELWGTDAHLLHPGPPPEKQLSLAGHMTKKVIHFHQNVLSEADGPRSHFRPTSSQYMMEAIHEHGFFKGYAMGCDRLMRENDERWIYPIIQTEIGSLAKHDPVKPCQSKKAVR